MQIPPKYRPHSPNVAPDPVPVAESQCQGTPASKPCPEGKSMFGAKHEYATSSASESVSSMQTSQEDLDYPGYLLSHLSDSDSSEIQLPENHLSESHSSESLSSDSQLDVDQPTERHLELTTQSLASHFPQSDLNENQVPKIQSSESEQVQDRLPKIRLHLKNQKGGILRFKQLPSAPPPASHSHGSEFHGNHLGESRLRLNQLPGSLKRKREGSKSDEFQPSALAPPVKLLRVKPPSPYRIGYRFTIHANPQWELDSATEGSLLRNPSNKKNRKPSSIPEKCSQSPSRQDSRGQGTLNIKIDRLVQDSTSDQAQVLTITLSGDSATQQYHAWGLPDNTSLVAKVFDPVYLKDYDGSSDPVETANRLYKRETRAYRELSDLQGHLIPRYFGTYALYLPMPKNPQKYREVRMIIVEAIKGWSMAQVVPETLSQSRRQTVMSNIIRVESEIFARGISLVDLAPRNVMIDSNTFEVVLIDFGDVRFRRDRWQSTPERIRRIQGLYVTPILRWQNSPLEFEDWIDWKWNPWLAKEFASTLSTITPEILEAFRRFIKTY